MIKSKNSNAVTWTDLYTYSQLPKELDKLDELMHNLWWVWTPKAKALFESISPELWEQTEGNPIQMCKLLSTAQLEDLRTDKKFLNELDNLYTDFQTYMNEPVDQKRPSVAYLCMEYGLTNILKIYSGGLGVLAGDYIKEASDSNVKMTAVGFLYRYGYFTQGLSQEGDQLANYEAQEFTQLPLKQVLNDDGSAMLLEVPYSNYTVYCHVWEVNVGRIKLYLLDTDNTHNSEWDRPITHQLYGGDWENRMKQEYLLGIGGVLLLNKLGIKKDVYHMNEGHAAFMNVQRLLDFVEGEHLPFDLALELVRASSLYTVHTPVPAGHDYFDEGLMGKYLGHIPDRLGISWEEFMDMGRENVGTKDKFSMSTFALNTCQEANGVSKLHGIVSQEMFAGVWKGYFPNELHVGYVTNGVHMPTWSAPQWQELYNKHLGKDFVQKQTEEEVWGKLEKLKNSELWDIHYNQKLSLIEHIRAYYGEKWIKRSSNPKAVKTVLDGLNPNALLIGFGRRFATYKRAHLLFTDLERLARLVNNPKYPIQFLFTGKAHPADGGGQGLIKKILEISRRPEFLGKIIFLENYDMRLASKLIAGVDVWMNTPTRPLEASGTSGEKAQMNGVLNLSVLDGWWYEGYREGAGWALTDKRTFENQELQDKLDATTIYDLIEKEIAPLYFDERKEGGSFSDKWVETMKKSLKEIAPHYTMRRMMDDYFERFYNKLALRSQAIQANDCKVAKELVEWKSNIAQNWNSLHVLELKRNKQENGANEVLELSLNKGEIKGELVVELVVAQEDEKGMLQLVEALPLALTEENGATLKYMTNIAPRRAGHYKLGLRVLPWHKAMPHRMDFAYIHWIALQ